MRVEILRGLGGPVVLDGVTRVLVLNDQGTPISVASQWMPGVAIASHAGEGAKFTQILAGLGVDRTVLAVPLKAKPSLLG